MLPACVIDHLCRRASLASSSSSVPPSIRSHRRRRPRKRMRERERESTGEPANELLAPSLRRESGSGSLRGDSSLEELGADDDSTAAQMRESCPSNSIVSLADESARRVHNFPGSASLDGNFTRRSSARMLMLARPLRSSQTLPRSTGKRRTRTSSSIGRLARRASD